MKSIKEALTKAYTDAGQSLPVLPKPQKSDKGNAKSSKPKHGNRQEKPKNTKNQSKRHVQTFDSTFPKARGDAKLSNVVSPSKPATATPTIKPIPKASLKVNGELSYKVTLHSDRPRKPLEFNPELGSRLQLNNGNGDLHHITIGLDFGTSSLKAVVGDADLDKFFAVPFVHGAGIDEYLLPSRLYVNLPVHDCDYSLSAGDEVVRDLKLSLLANPHSETCRVNVAVFLALVLRHIRAWMFTKKSDTYKSAEIKWSVSIGIPSDSRLNNEMVRLFDNLVKAAWALSQTPGSINKLAISNALSSNVNISDLEVSVIPEFSAQIYGFVASPSSSFDPNKVNRYLIVDVGAGTVDASVFQVMKPEGRWVIVYFVASVQPNGVANLHAHRVDWWVTELQKHGVIGNVLRDLDAERNNTDIENPLPEDFLSYVDGVEVSCERGYKTPDEEFFESKLVRQIQGSTLFQLKKNNLLQSHEIKGLPMFVCGGGSRMEFYKKLPDGIGNALGSKWLKPELWTSSIPSDLECLGVLESDFDRLSVAYGLSRIDLGKIEIAQPLSQDDGVAPRQDFGNRYVGKDQC